MKKIKETEAYISAHYCIELWNKKPQGMYWLRDCTAYMLNKHKTNADLEWFVKDFFRIMKDSMEIFPKINITQPTPELEIRWTLILDNYCFDDNKPKHT